MSGNSTIVRFHARQNDTAIHGPLAIDNLNIFLLLACVGFLPLIFLAIRWVGGLGEQIFELFYVIVQFVHFHRPLNHIPNRILFDLLWRERCPKNLLSADFLCFLLAGCSSNGSPGLLP